jgi:hypothetical protein
VGGKEKLKGKGREGGRTAENREIRKRGKGEEVSKE